MSSLSLRRAVRAFVSDTGTATISGVVKELTVPVPNRPVYLFASEGLRVLRETKSGSNGVYSFPNMATGRQYVVLALDPNGAYNAVVADRVQT